MQDLVDKVNTAATNTGSFGRVEDSLIESAKDKHYPLHYAFERNGNFDPAFRGNGYDGEETASFAIVAKAGNYTFAQLETLWESVITNALSNDGVELVDFDSFDANFGGEKVRIALYSMQLDTTKCF